MNCLLLAAALAVGQTAQPPLVPAGRPAALTAEGEWMVVEISENGQIVPGGGVSTVMIHGNVLSFIGTGVQYPSLRLDFGPTSTVRASTTMENALPASRLPVIEPGVTVSPGNGPPPPVVPGTVVGRTSVGPPRPPANAVPTPQPPARAVPAPVAPAPTPVPAPGGFNTGQTTGRTGSGAGAGGVGGTAPGGATGILRSGPTMTGKAGALRVPTTMTGVYVLTGDYLILGLGTTTGNPRVGSGESGGGGGAVTSTGGTPRATPNSGGPAALVLILRRVPAPVRP